MMVVATGELVGWVLTTLIGLMMILIMSIFERNVAKQQMLMGGRATRRMLNVINRAGERRPGENQRQHYAERPAESLRGN